MVGAAPEGPACCGWRPHQRPLASQPPWCCCQTLFEPSPKHAQAVLRTAIADAKRGKSLVIVNLMGKPVGPLRACLLPRTLQDTTTDNTVLHNARGCKRAQVCAGNDRVLITASNRAGLRQRTEALLVPRLHAMIHVSSCTCGTDSCEATADAFEVLGVQGGWPVRGVPH